MLRENAMHSKPLRMLKCLFQRIGFVSSWCAHTARASWLICTSLRPRGSGWNCGVLSSEARSLLVQTRRHSHTPLSPPKINMQQPLGLGRSTCTTYVIISLSKQGSYHFLKGSKMLSVQHQIRFFCSDWLYSVLRKYGVNQKWRYWRWRHIIVNQGEIHTDGRKL